MEPRVVRLLALFLLTQYPHSVTSQTATSSPDISSTLPTAAPSSALTEISPSSSAPVSAASSSLLDSSSSSLSISSSVSGALDSSASSISFSASSALDSGASSISSSTSSALDSGASSISSSVSGALDSSASSISSSASSALDSSVSSISFSFHSALDSGASSISSSVSGALDSSASSISSSFHSAVSVTEMTSSVTPTTVVVSPSSSGSTISSTTTSPTANSSEQTASTSSSHSDLMPTMTLSINGTELAPTMPMTTQMSFTSDYMSVPSTNQTMASSDMTTDTSTPIITATPTVTVTTPTTTPPTTTTPPPLQNISLAFVFSYNTSAVEGLNTSSVEYQQFRNRTLQALASMYNLTIPMDITNLTISNGSLAVVLKITGTAKEISDNQNSIAALTRSIQTGQQNVTFDNLPATATQVFINGVKFDAQASPCVQAALIQACQYPLVCVVLADNITTTCGSEPHSKNKQGLLIGLPVGLLLYWFLCVIIAALIYTFVKQRRRVKTTDFNDVMLFDESLVPLDSFPKKKLQGIENPAMTEQSTGTNGSSEQHKM